MRKAITFIRQLGLTERQKGYGYLYNGYAINLPPFAATGWHVPTETEYNTLRTALGGFSVAGGKMKEAGNAHWESPNTSADNSSGFTGWGTGFRRHDDGEFSSLFRILQIWLQGNNYYSITLAHTTGQAGLGVDSFPAAGRSVRLIKDTTTLSDGDKSTMTDIDGNIYNTICIGTQEWTVENWKCTKLNNGTALTKVTDNTTWKNAGGFSYYYCAFDNNETNI